jgi:hypothetical protein
MVKNLVEYLRKVLDAPMRLCYYTLIDNVITKDDKVKELNVNIVSKGRKYFKAEFNGYIGKLVIDAASEHLEVGSHSLICEDLSVRSKYGTDVIYKVVADKKESQGIVTLKHDRYNSILVKECKKLAGKWDADEKAWVFDSFVEDEVEDLDILFNGEEVTVILTATDDCYMDAAPIDFCGYRIATAFGRDSGAKLAEGIVQLSGTIKSGGSSKNWVTRISEGSTFKIKISRAILDLYGNERNEFTYEVIA